MKRTVGIILALILAMGACMLTACKKPAPTLPAPPATYAVTLDGSTGGVVSASVTEAAAGERITLTATPDEGWALSYLELNGVRLDGTEFIMPEQDAVVYACFVTDATEYTVTAQNTRYGVVTVDRATCLSGGTVIAEHIPTYGYVLDHYTVNGVDVGTSGRIVMPAQNAVVSAVFRAVFADTALTVSAFATGVEAISHWSFVYGEDALLITVKVEDALLILTDEVQFRDHVECIVALAPTQSGWITGRTVRLAVTADGTCYMRTAVRDTAFGARVFDFEDTLWSATSVRKTIQGRDGYSGYEVTMRISYGLLGATGKSQAEGRVAIMPALRNSESIFGGQWACYTGADWLDMTTYPTVRADGTVEEVRV